MRNMVYYFCQRFMTENFPDYLEGTGFRNEEIVSVDCSLFPFDERREYDGKFDLAPNEQLLAVLMVGKNDEIPMLAGFEFCGFDLAEGDEFSVAGTSTLTNCPGFDGVFSVKDLNQYGLLDSREEAERLQELLPQKYPDEQHAYCEIYAIWRRVSIFYSFDNRGERRAVGGSAFLQLAYCKLKQNARIRKIVSLRSIPYWQNDSLYVYVDDIDIFCSNYAEIFGESIFNSRTKGDMDIYGINYYSPSQLKDIIDKVEKQKPLGYQVILKWLKAGVDFNGIYILGI